MKRRFIPSTGPNNTIRLFDAETGQLYRTTSAPGQIVGQPIAISESEMYVEVSHGGTKTLYYYNLPTLTVTKTIGI